MMTEIKINGIKYRQKVNPESKESKALIDITTMIAMGFYPMYQHNKTKTKSKPLKFNIVKEYELIQLKKSNLSRSQRETIVFEFEKEFEIN
jgi:hypothetical protein